MKSSSNLGKRNKPRYIDAVRGFIPIRVAHVAHVARVVCVVRVARVGRTARRRCLP